METPQEGNQPGSDRETEGDDLVDDYRIRRAFALDRLLTRSASSRSHPEATADRDDPESDSTGGAGLERPDTATSATSETSDNSPSAEP